MNRRVLRPLQKPGCSLAAKFTSASEANVTAGDLEVKNKEMQKGCRQQSYFCISGFNFCAGC